jgi:hypothetical protein
MIINPYRFAATGDPNFSSVVLLLHCDGTNGSTTFTDYSNSAKTVTANNQAQVSTASPKFGTGACELDGSQDYLSLVDSADWDFASGDFTIEMWIKPDSVTGFQSLFNQRSSSANYCPVIIALDASTLVLLLSFTGSSWAAVYTISGGTVTTGNWQFVQLVRSGNDFKMYLDGVQVGSTYNSSSTLYNSTESLLIGGSGNTFWFDGQIDDVRVTKGVARANQVPTAAFPNS